MRTDPHAVKTLEKRTVRFASAGSPVLSRRLTGEHVEYGLMGAARKASLTKTNPPYPPLSGGQERATPLVERSTINSPLEGVGLSPREARQRPSGLCEGRCGGGSFYPWHVPPPNRLRASPLALRLPLKGGVDPFLRGVLFYTPLTRGGRGGCLYPLTKGVGGSNATGEGAFVPLTKTLSTTPKAGVDILIRRGRAGCPIGDSVRRRNSQPGRCEE